MLTYEEALNLIKETYPFGIVLASAELEDCFVFTVGNERYNDPDECGNADTFSVFKKDKTIDHIDMVEYYEIFDPSKVEMAKKTFKKLV